MTGCVELVGLGGIGEVVSGDDLAQLLVEAVEHAGRRLQDGDIVVVSSKVVAKAEGRLSAAEDRERLLDEQTVRVVAERVTPRGRTQIVRTTGGLVMAAAGIDASNVPADTVLALPADPDASARRLRHRLADLTGATVGVVVSDTMGRAWRNGQVDAAVGAAGVRVGDDLTGRPDTSGRPMEVTYRALADELASAADLVKGKVDGVPAALVRGLPDLVLPAGSDGDPGAAPLQRPAEQDWFRWGHAEAVRAALGIMPGSPDVAVQPVASQSLVERLRRAVAVAMNSPAWPVREDGPQPWAHAAIADEADLAEAVTADGGEPSVQHPDEAAMVVFMLHEDAGPHEVAALGALAQRAMAAAWAEDLEAAMVARYYVPPTSIGIRVVDRPRTDRPVRSVRVAPSGLLRPGCSVRVAPSGCSVGVLPCGLLRRGAPLRAAPSGRGPG